MAERAVQELENELLRNDPLGGPCVPSETSSIHSQPQRAHPIMWLFLQRDVDTAGSILKPSNTTARQKHHRSVKETAHRQPHPQREGKGPHLEAPPG